MASHSIEYPFDCEELKLPKDYRRLVSGLLLEAVDEVEILISVHKHFASKAFRRLNALQLDQILKSHLESNRYLNQMRPHSRWRKQQKNS